MMKRQCFISAFILLAFAFVQSTEAKSWKFVVFGDTHVPSSDTIMEMIPFIEKEQPDLIIVPGDLVDGGLKCTSAELLSQLNIWTSAFEPFIKKGIKIYSVRGNHEDDAKEDIEVWRQVFSGEWQLPLNGPAGEEGLTYSFSHKNAKFIGLDNYIDIHLINQVWLDAELSAAEMPHIFVFAHEAAFKVFHTDCLDDSLAARDKFWQSLSNSGVKAYFCGHDHFYNVTRIDDQDGETDNDVFQFLVGSGGGWLMPKHNLNGENSIYKPVELIHKIEHGYAIVEVSGETADDLDVSITWKGRYFDEESGEFIYLPIDDAVSYTAAKKASAIEEDNLLKNTISPIPASDFIEINLETCTALSNCGTAGGCKIKIFNTYGELVFSNVLHIQDAVHLKRIDISAIPIGVYYIQMGNYSERFMVVR